MDTNVNYQQFNGNLSPYLNKSFSYGDLTNLNSQMGQSAGNQPTFINGGNIYQVKDNGNNTFSLQQIDTVGNRQSEAAQQLYQQQQGSAIQTLQTGKSNLAGQYGSLLQTVTGEYQPLINQQTANVGAQLAQRGLAPGAGLYDNTVGSFLQPIYGSEASNAQQIGAGSIADTNTYNQAISNAQQSGAQFGATLPLEYGSLALQQSLLPSQIGLNQAQANQQNAQATNYPASLQNALKIAGLQFSEPFNTAGQVYNPLTGQFKLAGGGASPDIAMALKYLKNQKSNRPSTTSIQQLVK